MCLMLTFDVDAPPRAIPVFGAVLGSAQLVLPTYVFGTRLQRRQP